MKTIASPAAPGSEEVHSCGSCASLAKEVESWELQHIWWWECDSRPGVQNLTSFPFKRTKCRDWTPRRPAEPR